MIPFPFNENRFSFFIADHLLVGQLCSNPKSDRSLLSCLKVTHCSTSKIGDAPLYNSCSQPIQVMTTGLLPAPSKCKSGWFNAWGWRKQSFQLRLWTLEWFQVRATSCTSHLRSWLESQHQSVPRWAEECGDFLVQSDSWWQTLGVAAGLGAGHKSKETQAWLQKECYDFVPFSHWLPPHLTWTRGTTSFGHTSRTSPTWPLTTPKPAWSPSSRRHLWKRHAPSSRSVSRRW